MFRPICQITRNDEIIRSQKYGLQFLESIKKEVSGERSVRSYFDKMPDLHQSQ